MEIGSWLSLRRGKREAQSERSERIGPVQMELLEARLLLSADLIGSGPLAPLDALPAQQAIQIDLGQEDPQAQESDPSLVLSYLASTGDQAEVADMAAPVSPAEPALPTTDRLAPVQDQLGAALEAPLEAEGSTPPSMDESSCLIAVDQQDVVPSPEGSPVEARAPPTQGTSGLSDPMFVDPALEQVAAGLRATSSSALEFFAASPALFVENRGQWADASVRYVHDGESMDVAVTDSGVCFQATVQDQGEDSPSSIAPERDPWQTTDTVVRMLTFSASFIGAEVVQPVGLERSGSSFGYCVGDQANWREGVPSYETVAYDGLYEGIDLHIQGLRSHLKYEFHVAPGVDYHQIAVRYEGIEGLSVAEDGSLEVDLGGEWGVIRDDAPYIYQEIDGRKVEVAGRFVLLDDRTYSFEITGEIDPDHILVIDPDLAWDIYLADSGSVEPNVGWGVAVDVSGNVYATGETGSVGWTDGGFDPTFNGGSDAFVVKLGPSGAHLWSTYIGGGSYDWGRDIAVDASGVYVTGNTQAPSGWAAGGFDTSPKGGGDAFVAKLSFSGAHLWSTYLGGADFDEGKGICVDASGNVYVTGMTGAGSWTVSGFDTTYNGGAHDAFVAKLSSDGQTHIWSTYFGGGDDDRGQDIAVDASGSVYVTGYTSSVGWTTGGTYHGGGDAFVAKLSSDGQTHIWSTCLGGSSNEGGEGITVDASGGVYVTGYTSSAGWTSAGTYHGGTDAFVANCSGASGASIWSTYLGDSYSHYAAGFDEGYDVAVNGSGSVYVAGFCSSSGYTQGFVIQFSFGGSYLSTYLGSSFHQSFFGIASHPLDSNSVYLTGAGDGGIYIAKLMEPRPEITVLGNGVSISDGDTTPGTADHTDFGPVSQGDTAISRTFTVRNDGTATLTLDPVTVPTGFTLTELLSSSLAPEASDTFTVRLDTTTVGTKAGDVSFSTNDLDEDPFNLRITGTVNPPGTPAVAWSTYLGGSYSDLGCGITVDALGNVYVTGVTYSPGWTSGGFDTTFNAASDAFVAKFDLSGAHLWSTYLGGSDYDQGGGIAVDSWGSVYVVGSTGSAGWTSGGFDTTHNGWKDAFVAKLDSSGGHLWSTYLGGSSNDFGFGITLDSLGSVCVAGQTGSTGWTSGGFDTTYNGGPYDGFAAKLDSSGAHLWSTYLGGSNGDEGRGVAVDVSGGIYVTGYTDSAGWTSGGFDTTHSGVRDAFVVKLGSSGTHLWSTYLGGTLADQSNGGVAVGSSGSVYVAGQTASAGWTSGGFDTTYNGGTVDAFVAKLSSSGAHLWSTYLGGSDNDFGMGITVDSLGSVSVAGNTGSAGWTSGGFDTTHNGGNDAFVAKLSSSGAHLWSTYMGGSDGDGGYDVAVDASSGIYVTGGTSSSGWTNGGFDTTYSGGGDAIAVKLTDYAPEITVFGNGISIADGDVTPSTADHTDFGSVLQGGSAISRTFTVRNDGTSTLTLGSVMGPPGFTLTEPLSSSLMPGGEDTFTVRLDTAVAGIKSGDISFSTNDADENPFNFRITGTVNPGSNPEITVSGDGVSIADGDTTPSMTDWTDFGSVAQGGAAISRTFTAHNDGGSTLTLGTVSVPTGFTLTEDLSTSLAPGVSDTFTIQLDTSTVGIKAGDISFVTNDTDENPFNFRITGTVVAASTGLTGLDVGGPTPPGSITVIAPGDYDVTAGGADIWGYSDQFFYAYETFTGDFTATVRVDWIESMGGATDPWAKAGLMCREDLDPDSAHVMVIRSYGNGTTMQGRVTKGASSYSQHHENSYLPTDMIWLKLDREGNTFAASWAADDGGAPGTWQDPLWMHCAMPTSVHLGLATTSHRDGEPVLAVYQDYSAGPLTDFPTPPAFGPFPGPEGGNGYMGIREVIDNGVISNQDDCHDSLIAETGTIFDYTAAVVNFHDSGNRAIGHFFDDADFGVVTEGYRPKGDVDDASVVVKGNIEIPTTGQYTFCVSCDDGFTLQSPGHDFTSFSGSGSNAQYAEIASFADGDALRHWGPWYTSAGSIDTFGVITLPAGIHPFVLTYHEGSGYAGVELSAAAGVHTQFGEQFRLVGHQSVGTVPVPGLAGDVYVEASQPGAWGALYSLQDAIDALNLDPGSNASAFYSSVNFCDPRTADAPVNGGSIPGDVPFPNDVPLADDNDFGVIVLGVLDIPQDGYYQIGFNSDDGAQLRIAGEPWIGIVPGSEPNAVITPDDWLRSEVLTGWSWTAGEIWLPAGSHAFDMVMFERNLGAHLELFGRGQAPGGWDPSWRLLTTAGAGSTSDVDGLQLRLPGSPEITVLGNGVPISDGDVTPDPGDGTDFGSASQGGTAISRVFTVRNDGTETLTLGAVTVPAGFTLTEGLSSSLAMGASDTFTVRLDATTAGTKAGDISFSNDDADENPFNFRITGMVVAASTDLVGLDIGGPTPPGSILEIGPGDYDIEAGGADIWDVSDQFFYAYETVTGDFTAIVRVDRIESMGGVTDPWARAGLMCREDLDPDSVNAMMIRTFENGAVLQARLTKSGASLIRHLDNSYAPTDMIWLRLDRGGDTFVGSWAEDVGGSPGLWQDPRLLRLPMPASVYLGLATTSHNDGVAITAEYRQYSVGPLADLPTFPALGPFPGPEGGDGCIGIREVIDNGDINNQDDCYNSLRSEEGTILDYTTAVLNILDSGGNGDFGGDGVFGVVTAGHRTLGSVDDLSMIAKGVVRIASSGDYTFCVNSDDGFTLQFPGHDFTSVSGSDWWGVLPDIVPLTDGSALRFWDAHEPLDVLGGIYLPAGDHPFVLTYHEGWGGAAVEFSAAVGVKTSFDSDFKLVGDTGAGGLQLVAAPADLIGADIGGPSPPGSMIPISPGDYDIEAGGTDIWGVSDQFYYAYETVTGDFTAVVRVDRIESMGLVTDPWAKAGLMCRQDLDPDSVHVTVTRSYENGTLLQGRLTKGGSSFSQHHENSYLPTDVIWLKLDRKGDVLAGSWAEDVGGAPGTWQDTRWAWCPMPASVYLGLATTSHDDGVPIVAEYRQRSVGPLSDFPTLPAFGPFPGPAGGPLAIREVIDNGTISNQDSCYDSLRSEAGTIVDYTATVVNLHDSGNRVIGHFLSDDDFGVVTVGHRLKGDVDDLSVLVRGAIEIPVAGEYTFCVACDDGFTLQFPGHDFTSFAGGGSNASYAEIVPFANGNALRHWGPWYTNAGSTDTFGVITLPAGVHPFVLTYHEDSGYAGIELSAAAGVKTGFDYDFQLVGQPSSAMIGGVPVPGLAEDAFVEASPPGAWGTVYSLQDGIDALDLDPGSNASGYYSSVNFCDPRTADGPVNGGSIPGDVPFPNDVPLVDDDHFGVRVTGVLDIPQDGLYQIGFNSDDGAQLRIDGASWSGIVPGSEPNAVIIPPPDDWLRSEVLTGWSWAAGEVWLSAGSHAFEMVMFECNLGAHLELFGRGRGSAGWDPHWHLLTRDSVPVPALAGSVEVTASQAEAWSGGGIYSLDNADAALTEGPTVTETHSRVNFCDPDINMEPVDGGQIPGDVPFPNDVAGVNEEDFAISVVGTLTIPQDGLYQIGYNSDDGAKLRIAGASWTDIMAGSHDVATIDGEWLITDTQTWLSWTVGEIFLGAGEYAFEMVMFEHLGGAHLELFGRGFGPEGWDPYWHLLTSVGSEAMMFDPPGLPLIVPGLVGQDIGETEPPDPAGQMWGINYDLDVQASGVDIWGTEDSFFYAYQSEPVSGDFEAIVHAEYQPWCDPHPLAKASIMARGDLTGDSAHVSAVLNAADGVRLVARQMTGGHSISWEPGQILLISDTQELTGVQPFLVADKHAVTTVTEEYAWGSPHLTDLDYLRQYEFVIWGAGGDGQGVIHDSAVYSTLEQYIQSGGYLLVTGYDTLADPVDPEMAALVRSTTTADAPLETTFTTSGMDHFILNGPAGDYRGMVIDPGYGNWDGSVADTLAGAISLATADTGGFDAIIYTELPSGGSVGYWTGGIAGYTPSEGKTDWKDSGPSLDILRNWAYGVIGAEPTRAWLKLARQGDLFAVSWAENREGPWSPAVVTWADVPEAVYLGLATTSQSNGDVVEVNYWDFQTGPLTEFPSPPVFGPFPGPADGPLAVREVIDNGIIHNQDGCYDSLRSEAGTIVDYTAAVLNIYDSGNSSGRFWDDDDFGVVTQGYRLKSEVDDVSVVVKGTVAIPTAGDYTFCVRSDDGFTLQFSGYDFTSISGGGDIVPFANSNALRFWGTRGMAETLGVIYLPAGQHSFVLTYHERYSGAGIEFSAAAGVKTEFDEDFALVGHQSVGTVPVPGLDGDAHVEASEAGAWSGGAVGSLQDAIDALAEGPNFSGYYPSVNFCDPRTTDGPVNGGFIPGDVPFPNDVPLVDDDNFGVRVQGVIDIPQDDTYQIGYNSDDGCQLRIIGASWDGIVPGSDPDAVILGDLLMTDGGGWSWTAGDLFLSAGQHSFEAVMYEWPGYAHLELFGRGSGPGGWDPAWHLLTAGGSGVIEDTDGLRLSAAVNVAPVLDAIGDRTVDEGTELAFTATATDADIPAQALTFSLDAGAPAGASMTTSGVFTWTPTEAQGPGTYEMTVRVTDDGTPALDDFETFVVTVHEVNVAPVLGVIGDQVVDEETELTFTATATDTDLPANGLTFTIDPGAPAGAIIDPSTGVFTWTPSAAQGPGVYPVTVRVTDDGVPNLDDEETIAITVAETVTGTRTLPDHALAGETIEVEVAFAASEDDFNSVGLTDNVPSGWTVAVDNSWCTPSADQSNVMGDQVQYAWYGPYSAGQEFKAVYRVTVPADAAAGTYAFSGELGYKIGSGDRVFTAIGGDDVIQVVEGTPVAGITREVSGALLPSVAVTLDSGETALSDENGNYELIASEIRDYDVTASMSGFRDRTQVVTVSGIGPDHAVTSDFAGSTALIPNAPDIWYALDCVNLWLFPPNEEIGLDIWTALDVVNAWLYPVVGSAAPQLGMAQSPDQMDPLDLSDEETVIEDLGAPAPMRSLPASPVEGGDIFEVTVHFVADDDNFNAIGLTDNVPSGWTVEVDRSLCTPSADQANVVGDQVQYAWYGPYSVGWDCTARYRVTVPVDAAVGIYSFSGELGYRVGGAARIFVPIVGDSTVTISGNTPPVLAAIGDKSVDEGVELTFTATATDADIPAQNLTFTLGTGAPAGATIDSSTGVFSWTPTEAQGPGSYSFDVVVTDDGTPPLSDWETITITVNEVNVPPSAVDDEATVAEGGTVEITVLANDSDVDSTLLYSNVTIVSAPANGSAVVEAAGIRYTHDGSETVSDSFTYQIEDGDGGSDTATVTITVTSGDVLLRVDSLEAIPSGFVAYFNRPVNLDVLNLYDTQANLYGPADLTVVGDAVGPVAGSLIRSEDGTIVSFIKTGGPLEPDMYTVTLRSAADGFVDSEGNLLDGDADGTPGGDYVTTFVVESSTARLLSLPDFTRGPGQVVNVPATGSGIPITISDGTGLQGIDFVFEYDPALLTVTGVSLSSEMPGDWAMTYNLSTPGMATVWLYAPEASLPSGELSLVEIQASIPEDAPYGSIQLVGLSDIQIDEGAVAARCDGGVQVVAYLGDGTGNYRYSALDAAYLARVGVGLDSGFAAYRTKDPMLIGDVTGNGHMSALDAAYLARKGVGLDVPQIPDLPDGLPPIVPSGRDPLLSIPDDLTASPGENLTVPVSILDDATGLFEVELYLEYGTAVFDLDTDDVHVGDLTAGWTMIANVDDVAGTIVAQLFNTNPLSGGTGSVAEIDFHVRADAPYGPTALDLTKDCMLNEGQLVVTLDDGLVTIPGEDAAPTTVLASEVTSLMESLDRVTPANMADIAVMDDGSGTEEVQQIGDAAVLPGVTTPVNGRTVPHTTPSSTGLLGSMGITCEGGSGRLSLGTCGGNNSLAGADLAVAELMLVGNMLGWQGVNMQSPGAVSSGQTIRLARVFESDPGVHYTPGTLDRADAGIGWFAWNVYYSRFFHSGRSHPDRSVRLRCATAPGKARKVLLNHLGLTLRE